MAHERYILIDPTGINLPLAIQESPEFDSGNRGSSGVTALGDSIVGSSTPRIDFEVTALLGQNEAHKLLALARSQAASGRLREIVVYYLFDKIADLGILPEREHVPDFPPESSEGVVRYYPVIQGYISVSTSLAGFNGGPQYLVTLQFIEGTIRYRTP
jgi:hypothetical protein